jgi:phosphatidylglycerol phospholipase C
MVANMAKAYYR